MLMTSLIHQQWRCSWNSLYKPASLPIVSIQWVHKWVMKEQLTWNKCLAGEMDQSDNDLVFWNNFYDFQIKISWRPYCKTDTLVVFESETLVALGLPLPCGLIRVFFLIWLCRLAFWANLWTFSSSTYEMAEPRLIQIKIFAPI